MTRVTCTLREDQYTFFIVSDFILLRISNVSDKSRREKKTHNLCSITFFNHAIYKKMWKNTVEPEGPQMTIWRMRIICWVPKVTNTHSEYVIFIVCLCYFYSLQMSAGTCAGP